MEKTTGKKKGIIKKLIMVLLSLSVIVVVGLLDPDVAKMDTAIKQVEPIWLLAAFGALIIVYLGDTLMHLSICSMMNAKQKPLEGLLTTMLGFFYNALTPFQTGGQPMQVIQLRRAGMHVGTATSILVAKSLAWQIGTVLFGTAAFIVMGDSVLGTGAAEKSLFYVGFVANALVIVVALLALLNPGFIKRAGFKVLGFLKKHSLVKSMRKDERYRKITESWDHTINDFREAAYFLMKNKFKMLPTLLFCFIEIIAYNMITYFIYRGFSLDEYSAIRIVFMQSLLTIAVSFVPLPGASIASEGGFYLVFGELFGSAIRFPAMLLWRMFTYYSNMLFGLIAVTIDGFRSPKHHKHHGAETQGAEVQIEADETEDGEIDSGAPMD